MYVLYVVKLLDITALLELETQATPAITPAKHVCDRFDLTLNDSCRL